MRIFSILLLLQTSAHAASVCFDMPQPSPPNVPLCGNGVLDAGEICDDGNRQAGDGCNAFCSAFDALAATGTLAGGLNTCPIQGQPVVGGTVSNTRFCDLRAIEAAPDGAYVLLGDGSALLKYELFSSATTGVITRIASSVPFVSICSIGVLAGDSAIVVHDCGATRFWVADASGAHAQQIASFDEVWAPPTPRVFLKSFYDRSARVVVTAGVLKEQSQGCVSVNAIALSNFTDWSIQATTTLLATLPCTVYGVYENGKQWTSMDIRGMLPYLIVRDRCPPTFRVGQYCYAVHLQRPAHLEIMRAYLPVEGGLDLQYYANTHESLFDNALGAPLTRYGQRSGLVYTQRGACFQVESRIITAEGKSPPIVTLGNTCKQAPTLGLACATPLNNVFMTDAVVSPVLLPLGLSASHTHQELSTIFGATCPTLPNATVTGPLLYQSVLQSVYGNTTPVDFVELPNTLDVVYVTPTSVGLISTKRIHFLDRAQPGYVRATNLIFCPPRQFGVVGDVCRDCADRTAPGWYVSIAWQIQCPTAAAAGGVSPAYETFTVLHTPDVSSDMLTSGLCAFTESRNVSCPSDISLLPGQVFNVAADLLGLDDAAQRSSGSVIMCLIEAAEAATGASLLRLNPAEFMSRVVAAGTQLLHASTQRNVVGSAATINFTNPEQAVPMATWCSTRLSQGPAAYLRCAVKYYSSTPQQQGQRRLLGATSATSASTSAITHHDPTYTSSTQVSTNRVIPGGDRIPISGNGTQVSTSDSSSGPSIGLIVGIAVGCTVAVIALAAVVYWRMHVPATRVAISRGHFLHTAMRPPVYAPLNNNNKHAHGYDD
jgi:cysteine-rich repeat protein